MCQSTPHITHLQYIRSFVYLPITILDIQGTPFNLALPDLDIPANPHSAPGRHPALRERPKTVYIGEFSL